MEISFRCLMSKKAFYGPLLAVVCIHKSKNNNKSTRRPKCVKFKKASTTGKNNGFPFLDIFGYLKNTHKNPKFGKVRQVPTREFPTKFPDWNLSHSSKFGVFVGILQIPKNIQKWESVIFSCAHYINFATGNSA